MRSIQDIVRDAGGATKVAGVLSERDGTTRESKVNVIFKWYANGVPDKHWPAFIEMEWASANELLAANEAARAAKQDREVA